MDWGANSMPGGGIQLARKKYILILNWLLRNFSEFLTTFTYEYL